MRILHISDLHFGHHNEALVTNVKNRIQGLKADVILATGDFAHHPQENLLKSALAHLEELAQSCSAPSNGANQPRLIAVPGNHDCGVFGTFPVAGALGTYKKVFGKVATDFFFPREKVWIYGFNSARFGRPGIASNGAIDSNDIVRFQQAYDALRQQHGARFEFSYKIVALHHHPLPLRYSQKRARWLALMNAGEFLEEMLKHDIDLIVHGHEHIHAKADFGKRVEATDKGLVVVSVGTAYDRDPGDDHNRFNIIDIHPEGRVTVDAFEATGAVFGLESVEQIVVRSIAAAKEWTFRAAVEEKKYRYDRLVVTTEVKEDGDVLRSALFEGLALSSEDIERASEHRITLPPTSGYIDCGLTKAFEIDDHSVKRAIQAECVSPMPKANNAELRITYGAKLQKGNKLSLVCQWWAVNAMAMTKGQYRRKYPKNAFFEYTHFPVTDAVEEMVCTVTFPPNFKPDAIPTPYVAGIGETGRDDAQQRSLRGSLVYVPETRTAVLRVRQPLIGYTYGIGWIVPDDKHKPVDDPKTESIVKKLLKFRETKDTPTQTRLVDSVLVPLAKIIRDLCENYASDLDAVLMVFDREKRQMVAVGGVRLHGDVAAWNDYGDVAFEYGEGLVGRAFKVKEIRVYRDTEEPRDVPNYYRQVEGGRRYSVLVSLPVHPPTDEQNVYAVLNCGSSELTHPLGKLGGSDGIVSRKQLGVVYENINDICYNDLAAAVGIPSGGIPS